MYSEEQIIKNIKARGADFWDQGEDGGRFLLKKGNVEFRVQYSWGMGWEHVSVSTPKRCPTWEEMCFFKDIFWTPTEACVQYHPAKHEYINMHKYCLHIWRPIDEKLPIPDKSMVGV